MTIREVNNTPAIDATGSYEVASPYVLDEKKNYKCEAISGFEVFDERSVDVYREFYLSKGVSLEQYNRDRRAKVNIVSLMGATGDEVYNIPSSFIDAFPLATDIAYSNIVIAVDCGVLPDDLPIESVLEDFAKFVTKKLGITGKDKIALDPLKDLHVLRVPVSGFVDPASHKKLEDGRLLTLGEVLAGTRSEINEANKLRTNAIKSKNEISSLTNLVKSLSKPLT